MPNPKNPDEIRADEAAAREERADERRLTAQANRNMFRLGVLSSTVALVSALVTGAVTILKPDKNEQPTEPKKSAYTLQISTDPVADAFRFDPATGDAWYFQKKDSGGFEWVKIEEAATTTKTNAISEHSK